MEWRSIEATNKEIAEEIALDTQKTRNRWWTGMISSAKEKCMSAFWEAASFFNKRNATSFPAQITAGNQILREKTSILTHIVEFLPQSA